MGVGVSVKFAEPTTTQLAAWREWVISRPDHVRVVAERFNPWTLYRMISTGQRVTIYSFVELDDVDKSVALTVSVDGRFNRVMFSRLVFGISPDDLVECNLPGPDEDIGDIAAELEFMDESIRSGVIPRLRAVLNSLFKAKEHGDQ